MQGSSITGLRQRGVLVASVVAFVMLCVSGWMAAAGARASAGPFGISAFDQQITSDAAGDTFSQAGGHPYEIVTEIDLNRFLDPALFGQYRPNADPKDIVTVLPPGLFGNPAGMAQCTDTQLAAINRLAFSFPPPECPIASLVGTVNIKLDLVGSDGEFEVPLYNMVPPVGSPAKFGFRFIGQSIFLTGNVRNGGDFGITVKSENIATALALNGARVTFWGVPADPSHDFQRCNTGGDGNFTPHFVCEGAEGGKYGFEEVPHQDPEAPKAFLTLPVSCTDPGVGLETTVQADSWIEPGKWVEQNIFSHVAPGYPLAPSEWGAQRGTTGCEFVPFDPSISVQPTNAQADTPSGLNVEISLPQEGLLNPAGIATSDVKKAVVTLPAGESVSPSAADGLGACSLEEIGLHTGEPAHCPDSSKLGTVEIDTPLLNDPLFGSVYLGAPECAPCSEADDLAGRMLKLYIVVEGHGVILKLPGRVELDPVTGRIVTTFDNNPQLPFDHLKLNFKAGPRSPLVNPHACGSYQTTAEFTPWSGNPPVTVSSSFQITSGPNGTPCPSVPQAFKASFVAGTTSNQAGGFSPLTVSFARGDGEQQLGGVTVKTPGGLLGSLTGVPLCGEPAASEGACPAASEIGGLTVAAGAGANPFYVTGGRVFLTGPYKGAPFGLSITVPAKAGPLDLGTVVVRGAVAVDPATAALTVTTDPLPTILDGIPLDLRTVNVSIDRERFVFNPTNCNPLSVAATLTGGLGAVEPITNGFQVTNCAILGFKPTFKVSTSGKPSRANGASLDAKLSYPAGSMGSEANIAKVKVELPKQLPSRLTTLQKACLAATFEANPAACPAPSRIGTATATTPILPVPLSGPVYFVSHGGQAFPDLVIVLQGYGVTIHLVGNTYISKQGITSTTFQAIPDVPVGAFELKLPQGPYSALAANGNLCKTKLTMPTTFTAQNGAQTHSNTPITPTSCPRHKTKHHPKHAHHHKK